MTVKEIISKINKIYKLDYYDKIDFDLTEGVSLSKDEMDAPPEVKNDMEPEEFYSHIIYPFKDENDTFYGITKNHNTDMYHVTLYDYSKNDDDRMEYIGVFKIIKEE